MSTRSDTEAQRATGQAERQPRIFPYKAGTVIWLVLYAVEVVIALQILLKFMGANPDSPIVVWVFGLSSILLAPFAGLMDAISIGGRSFELVSVFAMGAYAMLAVALERLAWLIFYRPRSLPIAATEKSNPEHDHTP